MKKGRLSAILLAITSVLTMSIAACGDKKETEKPCVHEYAEGVCSICGEACVHEYAEGVCSICDETCEHEYVDGVCSVCGMEDPIPADGGESLYKEIVDKFKRLVLYKYIYEELPVKGANEPFYVDALYEVVGEYNPSMEMGYAFKDINGDHFVELFLMGKDSRLYGLFTIVDMEPAVVCTFQQGMGYLGTDGMIFCNTKSLDESGGQIALGNHMMRLENGKLVGFEYGWVDADKDFATQDDTVYYCVGEDGVEKTLTYDEYKVYRDHVYTYHWDYPTRLTKLNNLIFLYALTDPPSPQIVASFSSYDKIIKTFGLMHSDVAGGKYVRSHWTASAYDSAMIFTDDKDFVLYNQLIAACVLVQNSAKAVFGYAKKDLNGDGVEELILLESKYYVLAIFTQVDGKPVLLDVYNDRRSACIDGDGNIHVKERVIPGHKKDYEYFVYEVGAGALVSKTAIGVKYDATDAQSSIYKIVDGVATEIEQTEWDALYAEYSADIGTTAFNEYTENNAQLTFVSTATAAQ